MTNAALDRISVAVLPVIAGRWAARAVSHVFADGDCRLDPFVRAPLPDPVSIVGPISSDCLGAFARPSPGLRDQDLVHEIDEEGRLVTLTGRQDGPKREALPVCKQMDLGGEPASTVAKGRSYSFVSLGSVPFLLSFGPPAAALAA